MNSFEGACDDCPLRKRVDVDRASEARSWGTGGVQSQLSDGVNWHTISLADGEVEDSETVRAVRQGAQQAIAECAGPDVGILRSRCGAGLASAWRWLETKGQYTPNVASPNEITRFLEKADYRDAMPYSSEPILLVGDPRDFSELDCSDNSAFTNIGIKKLTRTVRGTSAKLPKGAAIMLDRVILSVDDEVSKTVYRIRVAQGGPHYAFLSHVELNRSASVKEQKRAIKMLLAVGVFGYVFSREADLKQSQELIARFDNVEKGPFDENLAWLDIGD